MVTDTVKSSAFAHGEGQAGELIRGERPDVEPPEAAHASAPVERRADRDAPELHRRALREPADRLPEDEHVGMRIARGRLVRLRPVDEQGKDRVRVGRREDGTGRGRLEGDASDQDGQE